MFCNEQVSINGCSLYVSVDANYSNGNASVKFTISNTSPPSTEPSLILDLIGRTNYGAESNLLSFPIGTLLKDTVLWWRFEIDDGGNYILDGTIGSTTLTADCAMG